jgi:hypothetical protein
MEMKTYLGKKKHIIKQKTHKMENWHTRQKQSRDLSEDGSIIDQAGSPLHQHGPYSDTRSRKGPGKLLTGDEKDEAGKEIEAQDA